MSRVFYSASPLALFGTVSEYGSLLWQFARREISGRYRGSLIGFGWAVLNPLLLLAIYTFVFHVRLGLYSGSAASSSCHSAANRASSAWLNRALAGSSM